MTIAQVHLFFFRLPLVRPLTLKGSTLIHREGYIIRLRDHDGFTGWGEISPLPGFSRESSADAQNQFASIRNQLTGHPVPDSLEKLSGGFQRWLGGLNLFPSVRFGVETTVLNLLATHSAIPLHTLLNSASPSVVSVNALLTGSTDDILKHAEQMRKEGYRAVKLKVGHLSVHDGIRLTKSVYERLGSVTLRLDANRAWNLNEAITFTDGITGCNIEYVEEPCQNYNDSLKLAERTGLPVALDESLSDIAPESLHGLAGVKAVVLKPTLLGGVERSMQFTREAHKLGMMPVISSSFESSLGILTLANLAAAAGDMHIQAGLDTLSWFEKDILKPPLKSSQGTLDLSAFNDQTPEPDMQMLTEVRDE